MFHKLKQLFSLGAQSTNGKCQHNPYGCIPQDFKEGFCKFRGFLNEPSVCYVRLYTVDNEKVIFCCQLPNYTRTSITNDIEYIASRFSDTPNNLIVIEHYAAGLSINPKGTYAIVKFDKNFTSPEWHFFSKNKITEYMINKFQNIPKNFFDTPSNLDDWRNRENEWY